MTDLKEFFDGANADDVQRAGDRCDFQKMYDPAKLMYASISNWAGLATTLAHLGEFQAAVDSAHKAAKTHVWREVHAACFEHKKFQLAQVCALKLMKTRGVVEELFHLYEDQGYGEQLTDLMEASLGLEGRNTDLFADTSLFTEPLIDYLKTYWERVSIPKVIRICEETHLWVELVFVNEHNDEYDVAVTITIQHSPDAWEHSAFKELIIEALDPETFYLALQFYLEEQPLHLSDLLAVLTPHIDHVRAVAMFQQADRLPLIRQYLVYTQSTVDHITVRNAYYDLLIQGEDYKALRISVDTYTSVDGLALARQLASHALLEFRCIAAHLFKRHQKWRESVTLSTQDRLDDAMDTVAESGDKQLAEGLFLLLTESEKQEEFCDVPVRLPRFDPAGFGNGAGVPRHEMHDVAMPYMVQVTRQSVATIEMLEEKVQEIDVLKKKVQEFEDQDKDKERGETIEPKASFQPTMNP